MEEDGVRSSEATARLEHGASAAGRGEHASSYKSAVTDEHNADEDDVTDKHADVCDAEAVIWTKVHTHSQMQTNTMQGNPLR